MFSFWLLTLFLFVNFCWFLWIENGSRTNIKTIFWFWQSRPLLNRLSRIFQVQSVFIYPTFNYTFINSEDSPFIVLSAKRNLSLLQSDIHWNQLHQNDSYLDTDKVILSLISTLKNKSLLQSERRQYAMKSQEVNFQKSQNLLASRGWEFEADK